MKKSIFVVVSILVFVLVLAGLSGCSKTPEDPEAYGVYQLVAIDPHDKGDYRFTVPVDAGDGFIELKSDGIGSFYLLNRGHDEIKWKTPREGELIIQGDKYFLNGKISYDGTLQDGIIELRVFDGYTSYAMRFFKEGVDAAILDEDFATSEPEDQPIEKSRLLGKWEMKRSSAPRYQFEEDGTGIYVFGENYQDFYDITWTLEGNTLKMDYVDTDRGNKYKVTFADDGTLLMYDPWYDFNFEYESIN